MQFSTFWFVSKLPMSSSNKKQCVYCSQEFTVYRFFCIVLAWDISSRRWSSIVLTLLETVIYCNDFFRFFHCLCQSLCLYKAFVCFIHIHDHLYYIYLSLLIYSDPTYSLLLFSIRIIVSQELLRKTCSINSHIGCVINPVICKNIVQIIMFQDFGRP